MKSFFSLVRRFGPLVAAFLVGLVGVIPGADAILEGVVSLLGFFGASPDPEVAAQFSALVAAGLLLYGSLHKFYNLLKEKFFPQPE